MTIRINGRSLATAVLARCLQLKGASFTLAAGADRPPSGPQFICINDVAISLLRDLFPALWVGGDGPGHALTMREVIWGDDPVPQRIAQEGRVVDVGALTSRLFDMLDRVEMDTKGPVEREVNSTTCRSNMLQTGDRTMLTSRVELNRPIAPARSLIESLMDGWMFLAPIDAASGILQAMVPKSPADPSARLRAMLDQSALISPHVARLGAIKNFPAAPAIRLPLAGPGGIFVGGPGVRLDPVSGEGAPFAIRTAILAAAVLTCQDAVEDAAGHYRQRIVTSFLNHLDGCQSFYAEAFCVDADWQLELRKSRIARTMLQAAIAETEKVPSLRLEGLNLVPQAG
ncbi:hypothetical protein [Mameliella sp.]|uniref:hypothetical protein n=1 Tax=Mameliella sp. TaxID=1924940 RepID=UPI003BAD9099